MEYRDLLHFLQHVGTDPSRLIFEDELTGICNRRFLLNYLQHKVAWDSLESEPVSLLMMDVDHFKQINDTYGHDVGDQALIFVAGLMKEVSGENGFAIRYAGDEFMILMPGAEKEAVLKAGEQLIQRVHEEPIRPDEVESEVPITLSIGAASAPDDAQTGKALIQKADTALYYAKKSGRDRVANAGQVAPQDVFPKTILHQLDRATIAGRKTQLDRVSEALKKFSQRENQFLIIEGAHGMGKSEFLRTIHLNLAQSKIWQIAVDGIPQEGFRPYYMTTNILVEIMKQRPDKGVGILDDLTEKEINCLSYILPQLGEPEDPSEQEDPKTQREELFATLVYFIPKLLDSRPLILLIDDLHFSDEATLLLLRRLLLRQDIPLFICGTAMDVQQGEIQGQPAPLERFSAAHDQELDIARVALTPLTATDIAQHFQRIFPQVRLPENFEEDLAQLTRGNPLFISKIQRKLVLDAKIALSGQQWCIEPLEEGYLPRSLEEIVTQTIAALDEESKRLLEHVSTFGENISLSMLASSSETRETKVLEFIDRAVEQGLISSEYQMNDDTIRFLSKRILDLTYGAIQEDRKQELHERIGTYQETLYAQHLLPSAATLAYHFQLSANQEKAQLYRESQQAYNDKIFRAEEAKHYTGEKLSDAGPEDVPLDAAALAHVPAVIRALLTTVRNITLYPAGSQAILSTTGQLKESIDKILADNDCLNITQAEKALSVNGEPADVASYRSIAETFVQFMNRLQLQRVAFSRGLTEHELTVMLEAVGRTSGKMIDRRFWQRFAAEKGLPHVELKQVRYTTMAAPDETFAVPETLQEDASRAAPERDSATLLAADQGLDEQDLTQIPQITRCLLTASTNIKLYPLQSKVITHSIEELREALQTILDRRPALTLARVHEALLVNGQKVDTTDFKDMADGFFKLLETMGLKSLSFLQHFPTQELETFISALGQPPIEGFDSGFWDRLARNQGLSGILFDQRIYGILEEQVGVGTGQDEPFGEAVAGVALAGKALAGEALGAQEIELDAEADPAAPIAVGLEAARLTNAFLESAAERLSDFFLKGDEEHSRQIINQFFQKFTHQPPQIRTKVIQVCGSLLADLGLASQPRLVELLTDPLLLVLAEEEDPQLLGEIGALLSRTATNLIQFGDYRRASRILTHLRKLQQQLQEKEGEQAEPIGTIFIPELEPETQRVLLEDLKSQEPTRLQEATQLLGSLGPVALPLLIEVIKQEDDLRLRQIAADLLSELGPEASRVLKRELVLEGFAEQRVRILEVIDSITRDLKTELAHALGDENPNVRRAAFRLVERLNDERLTSLLLNYAKHEDSTMAVAAIKSLGKIKATGAVDALVSLLDSAKETERLIACCRALGQIADPASIEPLAKIMAPEGFFSFRKKRSSLVRATGAFALAQISHPQAVEVLAGYVDDREWRVRQTARDVVNGQNASSPAG